MARAALSLKPCDLPESVVDKVKIGLLDLLSCVREARDLPWGRQASQMASSDPAFVNAVLGHGLVREDMHTGAVSHLGVVVYPTLLACSQRKTVTGQTFILAAACGYEIGASIGRALVDKDFVRFHRPTGTTGPIGGAVAGSLLLGLSED